MQRKGVRRDIEFLCRELTSMNAVLEKLAGMEKLDVQTKVWRDQVREMAYDIEDSVDIFMHKLAQEDDDGKDGLFHKIARKARKLLQHYQLANKIQEIRARVEEQSQSRDRYKIGESIPESRVVEVDPRLPAMYEDAKRLVGIEGPREDIIKQLIEEGDNDSRQLKVVSIVGFGGLGKTTLANQVYAKIKNEFECTAFVSVSRTPHMPKILKDILSGVAYGGTEVEDDIPKLIEILRSRLTNKRYFITIDDLWSITDWDIIRCAFVENNNASRVVTTTRNQEVGTACCFPSQGHVYQMQPLNELHSRRLFFKRLFDIEESCPEQFKEISNDMLWKCKGVPLAITSIASLLANHMHIEVWERIHNSLGSELDTNPTLEWMRHVLSLSYNDLSHELKTCLLYLGTYPEDYVISKFHLVRKWIAEGFVREKHGLDLEEAAENCFNELINRNLIQPARLHEGYFGEVSQCQVHDLMLDLIILKCKEENFITIIDRKYPMSGASQVRRISHQLNNRDMPLIVESMSTSTVRSYISFSVPIPLSNFELLRVLDMERSYSEAIMCLDLSAINHLFLLRYVRVNGFRIKVPKKFGKLNHLMTLDIFGPFDLPENILDFSSLSSLRHLRICGPVVFRNGLSKLCHLRDLTSIFIGTNSMECIRDLGELINLRDLVVMYDDCSSPGGIENNIKTTILAAALNKLGNGNLRCLSFKVQPSAAAPSAEFWSNCLAHPRHLQRFSLHGAVMPKLPSWIAHADRLAHAVLWIRELRSDDTQVLGQLPCLTNLELFTAKAIPENNIIIQPKTFHSLRRLVICPGMQLQEGSPVRGIEHLASLEEISVYIVAKCGQGSKIESACRDAISKHPKSQAMKIDVSVCEYDENGNSLRKIRNTVARTSGED